MVTAKDTGIQEGAAVQTFQGRPVLRGGVAAGNKNTVVGNPRPVRIISN